MFSALRYLTQILLSIFRADGDLRRDGVGNGLLHAGVDFMTAYLATSPGGLDTVAAIAAGSSADMALIMAMQTHYGCSAFC